MDKKDKTLLLVYLSSQKLMSLATVGADGKPWSATVYFLVDKELNFYFLSPTDSLHCQNIKINTNVSFTIADSSQKASGKKVGLQVSGVAKRISGIENIKAVINMWNTMHKDTPPITYKKLMKLWSSRFYKVTPSYINWFNEELYGEEEIKDWNF